MIVNCKSKKLIVLLLLSFLCCSLFAEIVIDTDLNYIEHNHKAFTSYLGDNKMALAVSWNLTADEVNAENLSRSNPFKKCGSSMDTSYSGTRWHKSVNNKVTYDRGHLCPNDDKNYDDVLRRETFLMCNIIPQTPQMNRGPWKSLEEKTRSMAVIYGEVDVVAGPIFDLTGDVVACYRVIAYNENEIEYYICFNTTYRKSSRNEIYSKTQIDIYLPSDIDY